MPHVRKLVGTPNESAKLGHVRASVERHSVRYDGLVIQLVAT